MGRKTWDKLKIKCKMIKLNPPRVTPQMGTQTEDILQAPDDSRSPYTALCSRNRACQAPGPPCAWAQSSTKSLYGTVN